MSVFQFLELQPIDPQEDGSVSELDLYEHDDVIDLDEEADGEALAQAWDTMERELHGSEEQ